MDERIINMTKVAIITGSTSGIGLGIAKQLAKSGFSIVINGLEDSSDMQSLCDEIATSNTVEVLYHQADLTDITQLENLVTTTHKKWGRIDILVNNAGIQHVAPVDEFPINMWDKIIALNLSAPFHMTRLCLPFMKQQGWGRIVHIGSVHSLRASPYKSAYVSAKHGIAGLCKTTALEVATQNITVNTICPAYVKTDLVEQQISDTAKTYNMDEDKVINDIMLDRQPSKDFIAIEEIAHLVEFLCSEKASSITGTMIPIDGAWTTR